MYEEYYPLLIFFAERQKSTPKIGFKVTACASLKIARPKLHFGGFFFKLRAMGSTCQRK